MKSSWGHRAVLLLNMEKGAADRGEGFCEEQEPAAGS